MKGRAIPYSAAELVWLEANQTMPISDYFAAFVAQFARGDVTAVHLHALRKRKGWRTGRTGHFVKGEAPHNKGVPCQPGRGGNHPNARKHRFKPGIRLGQASHNYKPIGTERITDDGYLERKIHDGMPFKSRWRAVQLIRWEEIHGPLPKGMVLKSLDGNRLNTDPANWEAIPRALLPRLNGGRRKQHIVFDTAPAELRPTILLAAKVDHAARTVRRRKKPEQVSA